MSVRIVIDGKEVKSPFVKFLVGLLSFVILTLFGVVSVFFILPLIGVTIVVSLGIFVAIVLAALTSFLIVLAVYRQNEKKQKRLVKK